MAAREPVSESTAHRSDMSAPLTTVAEVEQPRSATALCCERFAVGIVFGIFVTFRAADRVFLKRVQNTLQNPVYNIVLTNLIWPIAIQFLTVAMLLGYIVYRRSQGERQYTWTFFLPGNPAASVKGPVPLYQLALFSLGDQLNAALQAPASPFISQPLQSVMTQLVIPMMLVLAFFWLRSRFKQVHYIGCLLIILSVMVGLATKIQSDDCSPEGLQNNLCLASYKGASGKFELLTATSVFLWFGLYVLSLFPSAVSNVYKQKVLQGGDVDICYAVWWSGNFQVLWGILCLPQMWLHLPDQPSNTHAAVSQTFEYIGYTFQCFMGHVPMDGDESCASGGALPPIVWFAIYLFFNLSFNVCLLWLTKYLSALWANIATTLCLDLTNIFSQSSLLMGKGAQVMSFSDWLATALASVALWTYNLEKETPQETLQTLGLGKQGDEEEAPGVMLDSGTGSFTGIRLLHQTGSFTKDGSACGSTKLPRLARSAAHASSFS